jgi:hypothetical protein
MFNVQGITFIDRNGSVVGSAKKLAQAVVSALITHDKITVSLTGLRGVSSSYFNTLLSDIVATHGADAIFNRINFQFDSDAQRSIFQRSFDAVTKNLMRHA